MQSDQQKMLKSCLQQMCSGKVSKMLHQKTEKNETENCSSEKIEKKKRRGVEEIKNNDHFAISWQITIHQIVQITDISQ